MISMITWTNDICYGCKVELSKVIIQMINTSSKTSKAMSKTYKKCYKSKTQSRSPEVKAQTNFKPLKPRQKGWINWLSHDLSAQIDMISAQSCRDLH